MSQHDKIQPELTAKMNQLAHSLDVYLGGYGFALLVFPLGQVETRANYISNADRATMLAAMKEFIARNEGRLIETEVKQ